MLLGADAVLQSGRSAGPQVLQPLLLVQLCPLYVEFSARTGHRKGAQLVPSSPLVREQAENPGTLSGLKNACSQVKVGLSDQAFLRVAYSVLFPLP